MLGEHGLLRKQVFYEGSVAVPLVIRPPGGYHGESRDAIVGLTDVCQTILEVAGAEPMPGSFGRSLLPLIDRGGRGKVREAIFSQVHDDLQLNPAQNRRVMVRDRRYRLIATETETGQLGELLELYDLKRDPQELRNVIGRPRGSRVAAELREALLEPFLAGETG